MMDHSDESVESGGYSSENWTRRLKLHGIEDRISSLPDSLIQHIISFLPSTKQAIQTGILSTRWRNQWSRVPVLIFDSSGKNDQNFSQFIDRTLILHDCSKLKKFQIQFDNRVNHDPQLTSKIRFATRKHVEEIVLRLRAINDKLYLLPEFLLINDSLVKLELRRCTFSSHCWPNWPSLKELKLECSSLFHRDSAITNIISGSPLLESLELTQVYSFVNDVVASKSLKRLTIVDAESDKDDYSYEILCPNLEELRIKTSSDLMFSTLPDQMVENILSRCLLLHTLELRDVNCSERFIIASNSLKILVLGELPQTVDIEISCPNLEEADLSEFIPPSNAIDDLEMKMLGQLQHLKLLEIGSSIIKILLAMEVGGESSAVLYCKCLVLDGINFDEFLPGIICVIRSSPVLEKLVIKFPQDGGNLDIEKYWNSNGTSFDCSVSNLKTVKLVNLAKDEKRELVFEFVEFVLKNSGVLEHIVVTLGKCKPDFVVEVSKKLLGFQRYYPHTTIELRSAYVGHV